MLTKPAAAVNPITGRIYVVWPDLVQWQVFVAVSDDEGLTFSSPVPIGMPGKSPKHCARVIVGKDSRVYCFWVQGNALWGSSSNNFGRSWEEPVLLAFLPTVWWLRDGVLAPPIPQLAVNPVSGNIHLVFHGRSEGTNVETFTMIVDPDLNVLLPPKPVLKNAQAGSERFMPTIAIAPDGTIGVAFYERGVEGQSLLLRVVFAVSTDMGREFYVAKVSSVPFPVPPAYDPLRRPSYLGDYIALAADAEFFYLAWSDARDMVRTPNYPGGRPDLNIYFMRYPKP